MMRALPLFLILSACGHFPQVDAAAPNPIPPRPPYLTPDQLAATNAAAAKAAGASAEASGAALRDRAAALRAR